MERIEDTNFENELTCTYRDETYSVRDNGAVFRHSRKGARLRPLDEKWTFGHPSKKRGYMYISSIMVHQIVATAFHGPKPTEGHVVDHIDTNRRNNRPENLRWVTRLDNILLNPITRRKVEIAYGSIKNFLKNPAEPIRGKLDPNFDWMRSVTKKEAEESRKRLLDWAKSGSIPSIGTLDEWLYTSQSDKQVERLKPDRIIESRTPGALQKNWKTPTEFPLCPSDIDANALADYRYRLKEGEVFARNEYGESKVVLAELSKSSDKLLLVCNLPGGVKDWTLAQVSIDRQFIVHESLGTFFTLEGATKEFTLARGLNWEGGDTIDDYC